MKLVYMIVLATLVMMLCLMRTCSLALFVEQPEEKHARLMAYAARPAWIKACDGFFGKEQQACLTVEYARENNEQ